MGKTKVIKGKHLPMYMPIGRMMVAYLLYKSIDPQGTAKGVLLTLFVGYAILMWGLWASQLWFVEFREPGWEEPEKDV